MAPTKAIKPHHWYKVEDGAFPIFIIEVIEGDAYYPGYIEHDFEPCDSEPLYKNNGDRRMMQRSTPVMLWLPEDKVLT